MFARHSSGGMELNPAGQMSCESQTFAQWAVTSIIAFTMGLNLKGPHSTLLVSSHCVAATGKFWPVNPLLVMITKGARLPSLRHSKALYLLSGVSPGGFAG